MIITQIIFLIFLVYQIEIQFIVTKGENTAIILVINMVSIIQIKFGKKKILRKILQ